MLTTAHKAANHLISSSKTNTDEILTLPTQCKPFYLPARQTLTCPALPRKYSLSQLYDQLAIDNETKTNEVRPNGLDGVQYI
jgi:hypothetical protein